ncbi:MAG TPA: polysaccharide biosynthesis protein [Streptosporangiaceae bacterium]|nr:polysaccharide biosynthesis protein [Streptosporangiaceae bacterium]
MATVAEIISAMREAAPTGQAELAPEVLGELRSLTQALIAARPDAGEEYARFMALGQRGIGVPEDELAAWLGGATVLVTGGTGCIGSTLMGQVARWRPGRLVSVSRGLTEGWPLVDGAEYARADIRDAGRLSAVFEEVRPDVVFHVAAQRDPGLAEHEVHRTVTTNVLGTRHVVAAAEDSGAAYVVFASTGKALRPYSREIYTASKRAAEWLVAEAAARGRTSYAAARFTHVVDNSIIRHRLVDWCEGGVIRLHAPDIVFYAQSALESAQLLLRAGLGARRGTLWTHAITDLGWPVGLLDLALGALSATGSETPIYISGYDPGYESMAFPGLYDPMTAGDVSPLLSAFEAAVAEPSDDRPTDAFPVRFAGGQQPAAPLPALQDACDGGDVAAVREALDELSWWLLDAMLQLASPGTLRRVAALTEPFECELTPSYRRILDAVRRRGVAS